MSFDIQQPFVTQEQKFKYWQESKEYIKELEYMVSVMEQEIIELKQELWSWS